MTIKEQGFSHQNLTTSNILVFSSKSNPKLKITNFECCRSIQGLKIQFSIVNERASIAESFQSMEVDDQPKSKVKKRQNVLQMINWRWASYEMLKQNVFFTFYNFL